MKGDSLAAINARTRRAYNLAAQKYHDLFHDEMNEKEYDRGVLDRFACGLGAKPLVCDAGCGPSAHIGRYLFDKGIAVTGVDIADECVRLARRHNPGMKFRRADIGRMPFAAGAFDGVIAYYSIIDTPKGRVGRIFREFRRVLRPGGRLLVAVKAGVGEGFQPELLGIDAPVWFTLFTEEEIAAYFSEAGFRLEFFEKRDPYGFEIKVERIFAIGKKRRQIPPLRAMAPRRERSRPRATTGPIAKRNSADLQ